MFLKKQLMIPWLVLSTIIVACSGGGSSKSELPFQELYDQGVDRYLGVFTPTASETLEGAITRHSFGTGDGPLCFKGEEFSMYTRDGVSEELMIFLMGGGA